MTKEEFFNEINKAITELDEKKAVELIEKAINEKHDLVEVIEKGLGRGIRIVGDLWEDGSFFLPELMIGGKLIEECLDLITPHLQTGESWKTSGKLVIATIEGDIHSIGKTIVATMLKAYGFEVYDLGVDVKPELIVEEAINKEVDIIGVSALLTTTMVRQKNVIELLEEKGIRNKFKVILGGAPISEKWVKECGADGFAENAIAAVELAKKLVNN